MEALKLAIDTYIKLLDVSHPETKRRELPPTFFALMCIGFIFLLVYFPLLLSRKESFLYVFDGLLFVKNISEYSSLIAFLVLVFIVFLSIAITKLVRKLAGYDYIVSDDQFILKDALSDVREALKGKWKLRFENFSTSVGAHDFTCEVNVGISNAKKLSFEFSGTNQLNIKQRTLDISLVVVDKSTFFD